MFQINKLLNAKSNKQIREKILEILDIYPLIEELLRSY